MQSFDITPHYCLICYFLQHRTLLALKKKYSTACSYFLSKLFSGFSENFATALKYLNTVRPCKHQVGDQKQPQKASRTWTIAQIPSGLKSSLFFLLP